MDHLPRASGVPSPKDVLGYHIGQPNALLAWLRDHEPDVYAQTRWVLMCKDFIRLRLTGQELAVVLALGWATQPELQTQVHSGQRPCLYFARQRARWTKARNPHIAESTNG